jgi:hypothetical protein
MKKHLHSPPSCAFFAFVVNFFRCFSRKGLEKEGFEGRRGQRAYL